ncbi:hypothetical protein AGMMS49928_23540 [Spirochaetia bacterium]|nr:hypothetical protein AGMMS49928_23540 [Spirochaetia bacterium]
MKKILAWGGVPLVILALVLAGCNTGGPGSDLDDGDIATTITFTAAELGYSAETVLSDTGGGWVLNIPAEKTLETGEKIKVENLVKYSSVTVDAKLYKGTNLISGEHYGLGQFKLLDKSAESGDWDNDAILTKDNLMTGKTTATIKNETGVPQALVVLKRDDNNEDPKVTIDKIEIVTLTFKAKTSDATFSGSESFVFGDVIISHDTLASYQGKNDVVKLVYPGSGWAPLRVDLSDYADKTVTITLSVKVWMDQASKIMFQTNNSSYAVIAGGNESYDANTWVEFTGTKEVTLPTIDKDSEGNVTGNPWFYLDNAGLKSGATYYFADFTLNVE